MSSSTSMRAAVLVMVTAACGGRYPGLAEKLPQPEPADPPVATFVDAPAIDAGAPTYYYPPHAHDPPPQDPLVAAAMAELDPLEYARWPLGGNTHPVLEPAYDVASVFAQPGVSWLDLCRLGAQNRRTGGTNADQLEYLRAWCDVANRDARSAVSRLAPLRRSTIARMPASVRQDIANIVVDAGDAEDALRVLTNAQIDELAIYDLIAAGYAEIGKPADSIVFTDKAIAAKDLRHPADHCMRITRRAVLSDPASRASLIQQLAPFPRTPTCVTMKAELECWHAQHCGPYLFAHGVPAEAFELGAVVANWPAPDAPVAKWIEIIDRARLMSSEAGDEAATSAIESGLRAVRCEYPDAEKLIDKARQVERWNKQAELTERLKRIIFMPETICAPP